MVVINAQDAAILFRRRGTQCTVSVLRSKQVFVLIRRDVVHASEMSAT
jgi:hypothetical protein